MVRSSLGEEGVLKPKSGSVQESMGVLGRGIDALVYVSLDFGTEGMVGYTEWMSACLGGQRR